MQLFVTTINLHNLFSVNADGVEAVYFSNYDVTSVVTPVKIDNFERLLKQSNYDRRETRFVINSFKYGFDIGYRGKRTKIRRLAPNLHLNVGDEVILWNKVMKEVKLKRFAGPFKEVPFENFIQSPIGLVPKDHGNDTRLIFHLSYPKSGESVNSETPKWMCTTQYLDFSEAIKKCMQEGRSCKLGKSDMQSAFRNLGVRPNQFCWLILKARSPFDGEFYFFVDKCIPFGSSVSCSHFQRVSDAIAHIVKFRNHGKETVNYLDDFFFAALLRAMCDMQIQNFLDICDEIGFPVSLEKTFWSTMSLTFLGLLIDTVRQIVAIPTEKVIRAKELLQEMLISRKTTVHKLQKLCGFLNFLCKCVVPSRAFTRRFYTYYTSQMKPHHHINVNKQIKDDLKVWLTFVNNPIIYCRPFLDFSTELQAEELDWYTDASGVVGFGGFFRNRWFQDRWTDFELQNHPSIQYQELLAVAVSIFLWGNEFQNRRIRLQCDNENVCRMLNNNTTSCPNCMTLIRKIVLFSMENNVRIFAKWVDTESNYLSDSLSRFQMNRFWKNVAKDEREMEEQPENLPQEIQEIRQTWINK